jgi:Flp pilus assembly protein CpaB
LNRRVLIGIIIAVVGVGLIALGILAINAVLRRSFAPPVQATPVVESTTNILITSHDMAVGSVINREDVQLASVPVSLVPRDALLSIEAALGKITMVHLIQGEMVLQHHLADPTNVSHDIGYIIADNQVLMAFPSTDLMSSISILQRGDTVDIFASLTVQVTPTNVTAAGTTTEEQEQISRLFSFDALQRVQISAVVADIVNQENASAPATTGGAQPTPNPANLRFKAYLFAVSPQDALVLKNLRDAGAVFDIVLRSPTSNELFDVSPVTEEYLIQRYELQIPK